MLQISHQPGVFSCSRKETEAILIVVDEPFFLHFRQFTGQSTAIHAEIFRQLHSTHGDLQIIGILHLRLNRQVGQQFFPNTALGNHFHLAHQLPIFVGDNAHHVLNEPMMKGAGHGTASHHALKGHKQDFRILRHHKGHHRQGILPAGKGYGF